MYCCTALSDFLALNADSLADHFKYCPFCGRRYVKSEEKLNLKSLQSMDEGYQLYLMLKDIYERND